MWSRRFYTVNTWTPAIIDTSGQYVSSLLFHYCCLPQSLSVAFLPRKGSMSACIYDAREQPTLSRMTRV